MTEFLVLDIETVLDEELPLPQPADPERMPSPPHHRVVMMGALRLDERYEVQRLGLVGDGKDEAGILADFARVLDSRRPWLITFNGRGFDLPVIAARCLRHGVPLRSYYLPGPGLPIPVFRRGAPRSDGLRFGLRRLEANQARRDGQALRSAG